MRMRGLTPRHEVKRAGSVDKFPYAVGNNQSFPGTSYFLLGSLFRTLFLRKSNRSRREDGVEYYSSDNLLKSLIRMSVLANWVPSAASEYAARRVHQRRWAHWTSLQMRGRSLDSWSLASSSLYLPELEQRPRSPGLSPS